MDVYNVVSQNHTSFKCIQKDFLFSKKICSYGDMVSFLSGDIPLLKGSSKIVTLSFFTMITHKE